MNVEDDVAGLPLGQGIWGDGDREAAGVAAQPDDKVGATAVVYVAVDGVGVPDFGVGGRAGAAILVDFLLEIYAGVAKGTDDEICADAGAGGDVSAGVFENFVVHDVGRGSGGFGTGPGEDCGGEAAGSDAGAGSAEANACG